MLLSLHLGTSEMLDPYRTTCFSTHIHNIDHNISIYLIGITLFD